jgi:hypothetical protein
MTLVYSLGSILLSLNLRCFKSSMNFKPLLRDFLIERSSQRKQTGVVNMKSSIPSLIRLVSLTLFLVLMLINRMKLPRESTDTSSKLAYPC